MDEQELNKKVSWQNLDRYIKENNKPGKCAHEHNDLKKVGELKDNDLVLLTYAELYSDDPAEVFTGCYPYYDCDVMLCRECGRVRLFYLSQGGSMPWPVYIETDASANYLPEPAVKQVSVPHKYLDWMLDFPGLREEFEKADKNEKYNVKQKVEKGRNLKVCNYREFDTNDGKHACFDVIGERELLYKIAKWNEEANKLEDGS